MFEWSQSYSVGLPSIDGQHRNLFKLAAELYDAMSTGQGKAVLSRTLDRLVQYTAVHFAHEERLMRLHDYPDFAAHHAEHEALTRQVVAFQQEFNAGRAAMTVQLLQFLKEWLEKHIKGSDQQYAPFLKDRMVA